MASYIYIYGQLYIYIHTVYDICNINTCNIVWTISPMLSEGNMRFENMRPTCVVASCRD